MNDLISRQAAIDVLSMMQGIAAENGVRKGISLAWQQIKDLPSVQPDIIFCKDCKHWDELLAMCKKSRRVIFGVNDFCSKAERRVDE